MTPPTSSAGISRSLSNDLLLTVSQTTLTHPELRRHLDGASNDAKDSRGYAELVWLSTTLSTAEGVSSVAFIATLNEEVVGVAVALESPERVLICALHVQNHARGVGVGSALVSAVRALADKRQALAFALPGDRSTKNLYEQLGMPAKVIMAGG